MNKQWDLSILYGGFDDPAFAEDMARKAGKGGIQLTTHVANLRAQALYEKMGFTLIGPTKNGTEFFYLYRYREKI